MRCSIAVFTSILLAAAAWREANDLYLQLRVGLASGPLVGGVIGQRRMLFDVWGETVNTAARMESSGVPGRIHLAATTWAELGGGLVVERREIGGVEPRAAPAVAGDLVDDRLAALLVAAVNDDVSAERRDAARDLTAESVGRSGDQYDFALQRRSSGRRRLGSDKRRASRGGAGDDKQQDDPIQHV